MALDRLTKIDGGGISTTADYRVGIITATKFVGPIEGDVTGSITATDGTFSGNVTIGGTLTYEDVTNIDSVGIITARSQLNVGNNIKLGNAGVITATSYRGDGSQLTGIVAGLSTISGVVNIANDLDVDGHTNLDNVSVAGVSTFSANANAINANSNTTNAAINVQFSGSTKGSLVPLLDGLEIGVSAGKNLFMHLNQNGGNSSDFIVKSVGSELFKIDSGTIESTFTSTDTGSSAGPVVNLYRNSASPADADYLGQIKFQGESDTGVQRNYAKITGKILDASNGTEDGIIEFAHIKAGSQTITGRWRSDSLQLLNGTALTVAGTSDFTGTSTFVGDVLFDSTSGSDYDMQWTTANGQLRIKDDGKLVFGTSGDVSVYHNDTDFYLWNTKGNSYIQNTGDVYIRTNNSENAIKAIQNGAVELYHNNVKTFETTNEGVTFDTNSSSCVVRLTSNTDAVSVLQAFNSDFLIKAPSGGGINLVTNASNDSLIITSGGDINIGSVGRFDASGLVKTAHGSESAPSHSFLNDPDNGMYRPTTNTLGLVTGGTEKLRITSDGKIGMKTASPQKDLHVYNSSVATVRIETGDSRGQAWDILSTNGAQNNTGTISIRDESGSSYIDFGANGGDPRLVAQLGGGSNLLYLDKHGNTNLAGICTATAFRGEIYPTIYAGGRRNMFINGEFMIAQRGDRDPMANQNNGANGLGYGGPDHVNFVTNLGAFEAKQANENNSPRSQAGATYSYELDCTSASGPSTSNYTFLNFQWSGVETNRLLYGTSNARPVTISFWVQCNKTGNFTATLRNETANKLISSVVTISSSNTWEYKTITFVGDTAAQIAVTLNARWSLELWLDGGSNYTGGTVRTGWTTRDNADRGAGSTLNICSSTSNYFRISLFQVEMGRYATPFEFRTYTEYLKDCEYYFQKPHNNPFAIHIWGHKVADTYALRSQTLLRPTEMRINPTNYYHDNNPSGLTAGRYQTQGADYEYTYNVYMGLGSNKREYTNGTRYPYGVNGMGAGESGILWAFDYESSAEF